MIKRSYNRSGLWEFAMIGGVAACLVGLFYFNKLNHDKRYMKNLGKEAIALSAGEDRSWSIEEQLSFLKANGIEDIVIKEIPIFNYKSDRVDVYDDVYRHYSFDRENYFGAISRETLEDYIEKNNK